MKSTHTCGIDYISTSVLVTISIIYEVMLSSNSLFVDFDPYNRKFGLETKIKKNVKR